MVAQHFTNSEHIDELPFTMPGGIPDAVVYIRIGYQQYWKNPNGGWDVTSYYEVLETIEKLDTKLKELD